MIDCKCFECPLPDCVYPCPIRNGKKKESFYDKKAKMRAYQRAYYLKNKERLRAYKKAWYLKSKANYLKTTSQTPGRARDRPGPRPGKMIAN